MEDQRAHLEKAEAKKKEAEVEIAKLKADEAAKLKELDDELAQARENEKKLQGEANTLSSTPVPMDQEGDRQADAHAEMKLQLQTLQTQLHDAHAQIAEKTAEGAHHYQRREATTQKFTEWLAALKETTLQNGSAPDAQSIQHIEAWIAQQDQLPPSRGEARVGPYVPPQS